MSIFSFFNKTTKTGRDATISSTEVVESTASQTDTEGDIHTSLSISPDWKISKEQEYVLKFLSNDLQPLKKDQLSLSGIDIEMDKRTGNWNVQAFLRSSLDRPMTLGKAELLLLDGDSQVLAAQEFDLSTLGAIPALSNRPWVFQFEKANIKALEVPAENWTLAFNVQSLVPHSLDLDPAWEEALPEEQKNALSAIVKELPALNPREVNITGFQSKLTPEGNLAASVFIRNGHTQHIQLEKLPLEVLDATGQQIVSGSFELDKLEVKANTSKPWTFIFPKEMLQIQEPDLSRWTARVPK